ncbi:GNAT family N-acetyltransferase [Aureibacillus halotolerans]|uniref:RimJ/RimL family protein N-acetyltransferase n=1 Tax=Aureibacillus halotolerans TaxID=1508390 RepID=A0A4R6TQM6_9BACI|nr:GNAT family N-acetyltransferase [Aureibacillus halotolerans]TDQ33754.1 RimJ/RimL family protein N-acetyltransferase [Aureibacillus halotolerans]
MLRKLTTRDAHALFPLLQDPNVFPYVRHKADTADAYTFVLKGLLDLEDEGAAYPRVILDERGCPIGMILLYDVMDGVGFLSTWIGKEFFGKGYNAPAKEAFFQELFVEYGIDTILVKINQQNTRSRKASAKMPYLTLADSAFKQNGKVYDLFSISAAHYFSHPASADALYQYENEGS